MHKIEIKILLCIALLCFLFMFFIPCVNKNQELSVLTIKKHNIINKKINISRLSNEITKYFFNFTKSLNFKDDNTKESIKEVSKKFHIKNMLFKLNTVKDKYCDIKNIEIKFSTEDEKNIYDFILALQSKLNEIMIFDEIKILKKDKYNFVAKIQFRSLLFDKNIYEKSVVITPLLKDFDTKSIGLFSTNKKAEKYTLRCIINNAKVYINDTWVNIGDTLDDFKIKNIYPNSIDIQRDEDIINVSVGSDWK